LISFSDFTLAVSNLILLASIVRMNVIYLDVYPRCKCYNPCVVLIITELARSFRDTLKLILRVLAFLKAVNASVLNQVLRDCAIIDWGCSRIHRKGRGITHFLEKV